MKNKFIYLFIIALCFIGFVSCSDDDDDHNIQFYLNSEKVTSVEVNRFGEIWLGISNVNGAYTVKSSDETVATASIEEAMYYNAGETITQIRIKGVKEGSTSITVVDSENRSATLKVDVTIKSFSFAIFRQVSGVEAENATSEDQAAITKIEAEIKTKLAPVGGGFKLIFTSADNGTLIYYPDIKKLTEKIEGTFKLEMKEAPKRQVLKLNYNNIEYFYDSDESKDIITSLRTSEVLLTLIRDFTNDYSGMTKPKIKKAIGGIYLSPNSTF